METDATYLSVDRGYAFCNCRNIFYTDWENLDQRIYDEQYFNKYQWNGSKGVYEEFVKKYFPIILEHKEVKTFCEIGAINKTLLDVGKEKYGWDTICLDINECSKSENHKTIIGDIESPEIYKKLSNIDVIWMSHIVEHLKDPIQTMRNVYNILSDKGIVFVAMPDPYFIDWNEPSLWGHWVLREHHIMWDMESFVELMKELKFELLYSTRNIETNRFICCLDYHLLFKKKEVMPYA